MIHINKIKIWCWLLKCQPIFLSLFSTSAVAFRMYDLDGDDEITKDELLTVLAMMDGGKIAQDQLVAIVERTIAEADDDHDDSITFDEYCKIFEQTDVEVKLSIRF